METTTAERWHQNYLAIMAVSQIAATARALISVTANVI